MAHLVRQKKTYHLSPTGRRVPAGTSGAKKVTETLKKWYGAGIPGMGTKRVPLAADKRVAQKMLADLVERAERGAVGMAPVAARTVELAPLLDDYHETLLREASEKHARDVLRDAQRVFDGCKVRTLADLNAPDLAARIETFVWSLIPAMSKPNAAYIGKHARQFTRWLWRKRKLLDSDPLAGMDLPSQKVVGKRRALTADELARLLTTAGDSGTIFRGLTGTDRVALYATAVTTGFRVEELSVLTAAHFHMDAETPVVKLSGEYTKNGEEAVQPIAPGVVRQIRPLLTRRPSGPLWPGTWYERAARMLRHDLATAGIPATTAEGKADFHALRHTFVTLLGQSSSLKATQKLARHSTPILTVDRYSHADMAEMAKAVATIPLGGANPVELTRSQLEALAAVALALIGTLLDTRRDTPTLEIAGDAGTRPETDTRKGPGTRHRRKP